MKGYRTKKIALPGGKVIEIVYFSEPEGDEAAIETAIDAAVIAGEEAADPLASLGVDEDLETDLHLCPQCEGDLVYPMSWEERSGDSWRIERRCPNCEWSHTGDFSQDEVELFDDVLNEGTEDLLVSLRNFARSNMEEDVERLIEAIRLDLIQPMDF
jgi:hypothetical protein